MREVSQNAELSRDQVDALTVPSLIEFGASWCGHCQAAQALIAEALAAYPAVNHLKVEDGPGRRLGRSFQVKLWPTLIFLQQGREIGRLVRPASVQAIRDELLRITV